MVKQKTLAGSGEVSGIALHTGARAMLKINPAPENTGIIFRRVDLPDNPAVPALANFVVDVRRGTTIASSREVQVHTIEHVMAALHAFGVVNAIVDMDGMEPPLLDGSSLPYVELIQQAGGVVEQEAETEFYTPSAPIIIDEDGSTLAFLPADELKITCITSYGVTPLDTQFFSGEITEESFAKDISPSRTFVWYKDLEKLIAMGLVKGGSLDNAAILHEGAIISKEGLRSSNELVRHKVLDIVGDIFLTGRRIHAHIIAVKPGHPTNVKLAGEVLKQMASGR